MLSQRHNPRGGTSLYYRWGGATEGSDSYPEKIVEIYQILTRKNTKMENAEPK